MAGSSSRTTRRGGRSIESASDNNSATATVTASKSETTLSIPENVVEIIIPVSPYDSAASVTTGELSEDAKSETVSTASSGKSRNGSTASESSITSDETLQKSKDELIQDARDLDSQLNDLMKIYQHEKKLFIDKSIHLMETESHPDWLAKMEELQNRRRSALKIAAERQRLRVDAVLAEYDFSVKNVADELEAAEKEIIDEFTSKRRRRAMKNAESSLNFPAEKTNLVPRVALKAEQIDRDMSMIHRLAEQVIKSTEEQPAKDV